MTIYSRKIQTPYYVIIQSFDKLQLVNDLKRSTLILTKTIKKKELSDSYFSCSFYLTIVATIPTLKRK